MVKACSRWLDKATRELWQPLGTKFQTLYDISGFSRFGTKDQVLFPNFVVGEFNFNALNIMQRSNIETFYMFVLLIKQVKPQNIYFYTLIGRVEKSQEHPKHA